MHMMRVCIACLFLMEVKSVRSDLIVLPGEGSANKGASAMSSPTTTVAATATSVGVTATVSASTGGSTGASANVGVAIGTGASVAAADDLLSDLTSGDVVGAFASGPDGPERVKQENETLKQELEQYRSQVENMTERVSQMKKEKNKLSIADVETKIKREIDIEKKKITDIFRIEIQNLKNHIKDLKPLLKAQSAVKNVPVEEKKSEEKEEEKQEFKQEFCLFKKKQTFFKEWEDKVGIDIERKVLQGLGAEQERGQIRFKHIHVHRHEFKHIHTNIHIHIDEEMIKEIPNIDEKFKHKHTVRHTISHTNSQYLVPKRWFQR
ncbi:hypothetical protein RFI_23179 [Reticulomyxa filosa]|uniref:Uncharacterized protein n=1 Tax=Reticulomyxa filosa TaxID=46433 RepID=X6ML58_RETFI|nr:hypothetical protein RFI_23179 [Reticulomyxa filosa]|eukprot:ETO14192.1 hypothetical protein RFI_23179 [Reticulomyxa filosa]